jgi:hypothetical protein
MTEATWLACGDPRKMLSYLHDCASERKLRLFVCACCRRVWDWLPDGGRWAVEVAEQYADGEATADELARANHWATNGLPGEGPSPVPHWRAAWVADPDAAEAARRMTTGKSKEPLAQADLLRDLVGNPFRPVAIDPAWLAWNDGTVRKLARAIYDRHRFADVPVLADALEDAGCTRDILRHCRQPGEHARGCWVVDLLLGKE